MKNRNPIAVVLLSIITFGIYSIVWHVKTKNEMNRLGAQIPTAWLLIIPLVSIWWLWKYSEGVDKVTNGKLSAPLAFVILWLINIIGLGIVQAEFNSVSTDASVVPAAPGSAAYAPQPGGAVVPPAPVVPTAAAAMPVPGTGPTPPSTPPSNPIS